MSKGTTARNIRVPDEVWAPAKEKAAAEGTDLSALIRGWLSEYISAPPQRRRS